MVRRDYNNNGFIQVSVSAVLVKKSDQLYKKLGFHTRSGYIQDRLRRAIEIDEKNVGGRDADKKMDTTQSRV